MLSLDSYNTTEACTPCDAPQDHSLSHDDLCPVCLDEEKECDVVIMPCFHSFHGSCILNWVERNFSCPMCRAEVENFIPVQGQILEPRFTELWDEHFLTAPEEPPQEETKKLGSPSKTTPSTTEEVVIPLPLDEEELDEEEIALLLEDPAPQKKEVSFEPVVYTRTFDPQHPVLTAPVLPSLEAAVAFMNAAGHLQAAAPVIAVRLPNMTVQGALVLHTIAQQNYQVPHQLKKAHAQSHLRTKMQALNRVQQRRPMSTTVRNFNRVKPVRMDLAWRLPSAPKGPATFPPQPVLRQQAKGNVVNASKQQMMRKVHKLAILAKQI